MEDTENLIPKPILDAIYLVAHYAQTATEWVVVKRELNDQTPSPFRIHFSRRHEISKRHTTNAMELQIVELWYQLTGVRLHMPDVDHSLPRLSRNGKLAWEFLLKRYPHGLKSSIVRPDE